VAAPEAPSAEAQRALDGSHGQDDDRGEQVSSAAPRARRAPKGQRAGGLSNSIGGIEPDMDHGESQADSPNNATKYSNRTVDVLIAKARSATSPADRKALYERIRSIIWEDAPLVFVHYQTINYLMGKDVNGSTVNPPLELRFGLVWKT
jgi:ABC-type transport system substrate-binding protein